MDIGEYVCPPRPEHQLCISRISASQLGDSSVPTYAGTLSMPELQLQQRLLLLLWLHHAPAPRLGGEIPLTSKVLFISPSEAPRYGVDERAGICVIVTFGILVVMPDLFNARLQIRLFKPVPESDVFLEGVGLIRRVIHCGTPTGVHSAGNVIEDLFPQIFAFLGD